MTKKQDKDGTREECVLRFFAFLNNYQNFVHSVVGFFNKYMGAATKSFDYKTGEKIFQDTFLQLATVFPRGICRPHRRGTTSLILFEGVAVGAALALQQKKKLCTAGIADWLGSKELKQLTTGATNNLASFCCGKVFTIVFSGRSCQKKTHPYPC